MPAGRGGSRFSAALCRGLIEAWRGRPGGPDGGSGFPRLYAAASLKPDDIGLRLAEHGAFSAALCRGLIEATEGCSSAGSTAWVFRGFMPRPH